MKTTLIITTLMIALASAFAETDVIPLPAATKKQMQAQAENAAVKKQTRAKTEFDNFETAKALAVYAPRPQYPFEARARHITGSGVVIVNVNPRTGWVTKAFMARSTGSPILDNAAMSAFRVWAFQPDTVSKVNIPINFTMGRGASY